MKKPLFNSALSRTAFGVVSVLACSLFAQAALAQDWRVVDERRTGLKPGRSILKAVRPILPIQAARVNPVFNPPLDIQAPGYGPGTHFVEFYNQASNLWLEGKLFVPEGPGLKPAVVVLHGSGGLWSDDDVDAGIMVTHFEDWAQTFLDEGYVALFIDSYTPRGLVEFRGKRPAEDPLLDDAICSPSYERTKDAYAGLAFLQSGFFTGRVDEERIGLMGFSHGGSTALASVVSTSVQPDNWTVNYLRLNETTDYNWDTDIPSPQLPPLGSEVLGFKAVVSYYPGCGFHGYFGPLEDFSAHRYMPYAPSLIMHGSEDDTTNPDDYPEWLIAKSLVHADETMYAPNDTVGDLLAEFDGMSNSATITPGSGADNPLAQVLFEGAEHSFDEDLQGDANQEAMEKGHAMALRWFESFLK